MKGLIVKFCRPYFGGRHWSAACSARLAWVPLLWFWEQRMEQLRHLAHSCEARNIGEGSVKRVILHDPGTLRKEHRRYARLLFFEFFELFLWRRLIILYKCRARTEHCHSIIALLSTRFFGFPRWLCYLDSLDFIRSMDHRFRRSLSLIFSDLSKRLAVLSETVRLVRLVLASLGYLLFGFGATLLNTAPWLVRSARRQWVSFWRDGWNFNEWNLEKCVKQGWGRRAQVCQGRFESWIISHQKQAAQVGLLAAVRVAPSQHSGKAAACVLCSNLSCSLHICCCNYLVIVRVQKISIICRVFICLYVYM